MHNRGTATEITRAFKKARRRTPQKARSNSSDCLNANDRRPRLGSLLYDRNLESPIMKLKLVAAISALAIPALAHAQQSGPQPNVPMPTKADAQNVVQIITGDKVKTQAYCDFTKVEEQVKAARKRMIPRRSKRPANKPMRWSISSVPNTTN
jgi:hypothetical protein